MKRKKYELFIALIIFISSTAFANNLLVRDFTDEEIKKMTDFHSGMDAIYQYMSAEDLETIMGKPDYIDGETWIYHHPLLDYVELSIKFDGDWVDSCIVLVYDNAGNPQPETVREFAMDMERIVDLGYETVEITQKSTFYSIDVIYPKVTSKSYSSEIRKDINFEIETFVTELYCGDLEDFSQDEDIEEHREFTTSNMVSIDFDIVRMDENFVSIKFEVYHYYIGAAHGGTSPCCFNYDVKGKRIIKLADLFESNTNYLEQISGYCVNDLTQTLDCPDSGWIESGASPSEENLGKFAVGNKDLIVYFGDYQVACYAAGNQEVHIPLKGLSGLKRPIFNIDSI